MVFFIDYIPDAHDPWLALESRDAAHVSRVLRMRPGMSITVFDSGESRYQCVLDRVERDTVTARIINRETYSNEPTVAVTVYAGLSKGDRMDFLIQKCVECGVRHIVPFVSEHCVAVPKAEDYPKKQERLARIALEAAKQSGRSRPPTVGDIVGFRQALEAAAQAQVGLFLWERERSRSLSGILRASPQATHYAVMTGPEGGFSAVEGREAMEAGLSSVSLGPRILRCETAPVAALCAIMYHTGNFDIGV